jgi:hypothetical protein
MRQCRIAAIIELMKMSQILEHRFGQAKRAPLIAGVKPHQQALYQYIK